MTTRQIDIAAAIRPTVPAAGVRGWKYAPELAALRSVKASGVYVILDNRGQSVLYVGESHTGRLYDTITRHFREWRTVNDTQGRRRGGEMYNRERVRVVWLVLRADEAQDAQYALIQKLNPRDNDIDGCGITGGCELPV